MVRVRPGYARNFLIPRGLAVPATAGNLTRVDQRTRGAGGWAPDWSPDGRELFFWFGQKLFSAEVDAESSTFRVGRAQERASAPILDVGNARGVRLAPDGRYFAAFHSKSAAAPDSHQHLQVVLNWADELRARFGK